MKSCLGIALSFSLAILLGCSRNDDADRAEQPSNPPAGGVQAGREAPITDEPAEELTEPTTDGIHQAAGSGNANDVKFYLRENPTALTLPNDSGMHAIHLAALHGRTEVMTILLESGADVNVPHPNVQGTPLQYAAIGGQAEAAELLIGAGANIDATDSEGRTPLMWAADKGHTEVVRLLLAHGADASLATEGGWTAHRYAERSGHVEIVELLQASM